MEKLGVARVVAMGISIDVIIKRNWVLVWVQIPVVVQVIETGHRSGLIRSWGGYRNGNKGRRRGCSRWQSIPDGVPGIKGNLYRSRQWDWSLGYRAGYRGRIMV